MAGETYQPDDLVVSPELGEGLVVADLGDTVILRLAGRLEQVLKNTLSRRLTPRQAAQAGQWDPALEAVVRAQAMSIESANATWGVFSRSRVALLPHQLWVCRKVNERWPARWLVADDVGLGKTIEAGLVLWPLISSGRVRRLLVLCPASLVGQWQYRMRTMFDIRLTAYAPEQDTDRSDYWNGSSQFVASLHTLRDDHRGRHRRILEAEPFDMLVVDEAHHLNSDPKTGQTLGYELVQKLMDARQVRSAVFFTGTPHRGKDYGFLNLLRLLRPEEFPDPERPLQEYLGRLPGVMIRNNKYRVTDLRGKRLFQRPTVRTADYRYSSAEATFYQTLTEFVLTGQAYASGLAGYRGRAVMLVLTALQKLASSSVAAIRRALRRRLGTLVAVQEAQEHLARRLVEAAEASDAEPGPADEELAEAALRLMADEADRLRALLALADGVGEETKIRRLLQALEEDFPGRSVLFFTEYKATQSLLMSALEGRYGRGAAAFINGDGRAEDVGGRTLSEARESAAERFNAGEVRFLVSTEAGGEGIDLQQSCHTLINVDLPWNPMRLQQRVGRLNRYGQARRVEVLNLRNPDTVESLIWDKLNEKIGRIQQALASAMEEPEDLMELILGMTAPSVWDDLFTGAGARGRPGDSLSEWFDQATRQFGGQDVIETVKSLVGHVASFDYQEVSDRLPKVDLPALKPFLLSMLALNHRAYQESESGLSFKTPEPWAAPGVRAGYDNLHFDRQVQARERIEGILGVGHRVIDQALGQARRLRAALAALPDDLLGEPLAVFQVQDQVTTTESTVRGVVLGVSAGQAPEVLSDWQLLERLNRLGQGRPLRRYSAPSAAPDAAEVLERVDLAEGLLARRLGSLDLPFQKPQVSLVALLWPIPRGQLGEVEG